MTTKQSKNNSENLLTVTADDAIVVTDSKKQQEQANMTNATLIADLIENVLVDYEHNVSKTDDLITGITAYICVKKPSNALAGKLKSLAKAAKFQGNIVKVATAIRSSEAYQNLIEEPEVLTKANPDTKSTPKKPLKTNEAKPVKAKKEKVVKSYDVIPDSADVFSWVFGLNETGSMAKLYNLKYSDLQEAGRELRKNGYLVPKLNANATILADEIKRTVLENRKAEIVAPKAKKAKAAKIAEVLPMPTCTLDELKGMSYHDLQKVAKALRSNKKYSGNLNIKKDILLAACIEGMNLGVVAKISAPSDSPFIAA